MEQTIFLLECTNQVDRWHINAYNVSCFCRGVAQFGSALEWGSRGRRFESSHSDQQCKRKSYFGDFSSKITQNEVFLLLKITRKIKRAQCYCA